MGVYYRKVDGRWFARVRTPNGSRDLYAPTREAAIARGAEFDPRLQTYTAEQRRFWTKVIRGSNCWLFLAQYRNDGGYGRFRTEPGPQMLAHRYAYEDRVGPIPEGMHLDHLCRNPWCVRPSHMEPVVPGENHRRRHSARWDLV